MGIIFFKISLVAAVILSLFFFFGCLVCDLDNNRSRNFWREVSELTKVSWVVFLLVAFSLIMSDILDVLLNVGHNVLAML